MLCNCTFPTCNEMQVVGAIESINMYTTTNGRQPMWILIGWLSVVYVCIWGINFLLVLLKWTNHPPLMFTVQTRECHTYTLEWKSGIIYNDLDIDKQTNSNPSSLMLGRSGRLSGLHAQNTTTSLRNPPSAARQLGSSGGHQIRSYYSFVGTRLYHHTACLETRSRSICFLLSSLLLKQTKEETFIFTHGSLVFKRWNSLTIQPVPSPLASGPGYPYTYISLNR